MSEHDDPPKSPTNKDIMNFLTMFKSSIHTEISQSVRHEVAVTVRDEVAETVRNELAKTVRTEITAAVAPLKEAQREIVEEIEATKTKVSEIVLDNADNKSKISDLQRQIMTMQQEKNSPSNSTVTIPPTPSFSAMTRPSPMHVPAPSSAAASGIRAPATHPGTVSQPALQVLQNAKKVLGFSPITPEDLTYHKDQQNTEDDTRAMILSIKEFLSCEMKVPSSVIATINIVNVFPPAKNPGNWKTLYAEFEDSTTTDLINQYVRNLLPGKSVSIYVPHSLFPRYAAIRDIEHTYRNGDIKHKTRIKYGTSDFVLLIKPRDMNRSWSYVSLSSLPPLQLSAFEGNLSSSPPPGRTRLPSKRARSASPENDLARHSKAKIVDETCDANDDNPNNDTPLGNTANPDLPTTAPASLLSPPRTVPPSKSDLGSFHPSACVSPRSVSNKSFTFSNIPVMKNSLN